MMEMEMAKMTFQGRIRTHGGRTVSAVDVRDGLPKYVLPQNLSGPIQVLLPADPPDDDHEIGFLPANFAIESIWVVSPAGAGTITVSLPAYDGLSGQTLVAALADATNSSAALTMVPDKFYSTTKDRPLWVSTVGVTGTLRLGVFGFPLDAARDVMS